MKSEFLFFTGKILLKFIRDHQATVRVFHSLRFISNKSYPILEERKKGKEENKGGCISLSAATPWGVGNRKAGGWKRLRPVVSPRTAATLPRSLPGRPPCLSPAHLHFLHQSSAHFPARFPFRFVPLSCARPNFSPRIPVKRNIKTLEERSINEAERIVIRLHPLEKKSGRNFYTEKRLEKCDKTRKSGSVFETYSNYERKWNVSIVYTIEREIKKLG